MTVGSSTVKINLRKALVGVAIASALVASSIPADADTVFFGVDVEVNGGRDVDGGITVSIESEGLYDFNGKCTSDGTDAPYLGLSFLQSGQTERSLFSAPDSQGERTTGTSGTQVSTGTVTAASGMVVSYSVFVVSERASNSAAARTMWKLENPTTEAVTDTFMVQSDFGAQGGTDLLDSSTGATLTDMTRWITSNDVVRGNNRPVMLTVHQGPEPMDAVPTLDQTPGSGTNRWSVDYEVTVPAGETRYLAFFGSAFDWGCGSAPTFDDALTAAISDAANFADLEAVGAAGLLAGVPDEDLPLIANWGVYTPPDTTDTTDPEDPTDSKDSPDAPVQSAPPAGGAQPEMVTPAFTG
jgi:hypothetical protein